MVDKPSTIKNSESSLRSTKTDMDQKYQLAFLELIFCRSYLNKSENFLLEKNVINAGDFGNIVHEKDQKCVLQKNKFTFIQFCLSTQPDMQKIKSNDLFDGLNGRYSLLKIICSYAKLEEVKRFKDENHDLFLITNIELDLDEIMGSKHVKGLDQNFIEEMPLGEAHLLQMKNDQRQATFYKFFDEKLIEIISEQANKLIEDKETDRDTTNILQSLTNEIVKNGLKRLKFVVVKFTTCELRIILETEMRSKINREIPNHVFDELHEFMLNFLTNTNTVSLSYKDADLFFDEQIKFGVNSGLHGNLYEAALTMLLMVRSYFRDSNEFMLETQAGKAGKVDDIVFTEDKVRFTFMQLKHKRYENSEDGKKITAHDLLFKGSSGNFDLLKYIISYFEIKNNKEKFKEIKKLIVFTNYQMETLFDDKNNEYLEFIDDKREKKSKNVIKEIVDKKVIKVQIKLIQEKVDEKHILAFKSSSGKFYRIEPEENLVTSLLDQVEKIKNEKNYQKLKPIFDILLKKDEKNIEQALEHIVYAVSQPNEKKIIKIIKEELIDHFKLQNVDDLSNELRNNILDWFDGKEEALFKPQIDSEQVNNYFESRIKTFNFYIPSPTSRFVGREQELLDIRDNLKNFGIVAINGIGGIGKTANKKVC